MGDFWVAIDEGLGLINFHEKQHCTEKGWEEGKQRLYNRQTKIKNDHELEHGTNDYKELSYWFCLATKSFVQLMLPLIP